MPREFIVGFGWEGLSEFAMRPVKTRQVPGARIVGSQTIFPRLSPDKRCATTFTFSPGPGCIHRTYSDSHASAVSAAVSVTSTDSRLGSVGASASRSSRNSGMATLMRVSCSCSSRVEINTTAFVSNTLSMFRLQSVGLPPNSGKKLRGRPAPGGLNKKPRTEPGLAIIDIAVTLFTPAFSVSSALGLTLSGRCVS